MMYGLLLYIFFGVVCIFWWINWENKDGWKGYLEVGEKGIGVMHFVFNCFIIICVWPAGVLVGIIVYLNNIKIFKG